MFKYGAYAGLEAFMEEPSVEQDPVKEEVVKEIKPQQEIQQVTNAIEEVDEKLDKVDKVLEYVKQYGLDKQIGDIIHNDLCKSTCNLSIPPLSELPEIGDNQSLPSLKVIDTLTEIRSHAKEYVQRFALAATYLAHRYHFGQ